ncbi:N-acetylmuramoyl-L-alanine amidase [Ferruginibacter lapsinanis]|uniref:N-acetylmuramoyl-L-alanine amidase family protein n=1 Tax=Ferruginibacter lapsinanis TaxID=563172 RepID=UPI001E4667C3|nr:N-acetylmuramoyl-L-alanine amidase [Ferruginibacter lapsinanis]UEG49581.1 N-acetylmuramoyl-L-alanine amidase [Ferruginibacter lapsinanis]
MFKQKLFFAALFAISFCSFQAFAQTPKKIKTIIVDAGHGGQDGGAHGGYEGGLNSYEKNVTLAISNKLVAELRKQFPEVRIVPTRTTDIYQSPPEKADIANANKGDLFICIHADAAALKTGSRITGYKTVTVYDSKVEWIKKGKKKVKKIIKTSRQVERPIIQYYKIPTQRSGTSVWLFGAHKTSKKLEAILGSEDFIAQTSSDTTYNREDFSTPEKKILADIWAKRFQEKSIRLATFVNEEVEKTGREALGINQRQVGIWVLQATNMPAILVETGFITNYDDERYLNSEKGQQEIAEAITSAVKRYKEQMENPKLAEIPVVAP